MWTEFVSADGLVCAHEEGKAKLMKDLVYDEHERPIVAQFFSSNKEHMYEAGRLAVRLGFDGVDINMGCPDKAVMKQGAGAALIKNPALARSLIQALRKGIEDEARILKVPRLGLSVKTRLGYNKIEIETWIPELLKEHPDALIVHARTMKEMSKVPARWEYIAEIVKIRDTLQKDIPQEKQTKILGNGDLMSKEDALQKVLETGADGAMLGRAIFGNPWLFTDASSRKQLTQQDKMKVMLEHTKLFEERLGSVKNFALMKKHYKSYVNGFNGAKELRIELMEVTNSQQVEEILKKYSDIL